MPKSITKSLLLSAAFLLTMPSFAQSSAVTASQTVENSKKAVDTLLKDALAGDVGAQLGLARKYSQGEGVPQDHGKAVSWLRKAAEQNDAKAQAMLGAAYTKGLGVPRNDAIAHNWYLLSAMQDYPDANYFLGMRYIKGTESSMQDVDRGLELLDRAVEQGVPDAFTSLGIFYLKGEYVEKNLALGVEYIQTAASLGNGPAFALLGILYESGLGVPKDLQKAWAWTTMSLQVKPESKQEQDTLASLEAKMTQEQKAAAAIWALKCAQSNFKDCD